MKAGRYIFVFACVYVRTKGRPYTHFATIISQVFERLKKRVAERRYISEKIYLKC